MKFVGSPKPNRKFGFWGTRRSVAVRKTSMVAPFHGPVGRRSRWRTDKKQIFSSIQSDWKLAEMRIIAPIHVSRGNDDDA
jgi:hypothetical protein